jgi:hypothetical protein
VDLVGEDLGEGEGVQGIKENGAGPLAADLGGKVLWEDERIQGAKEDEDEQAERVEEIMLVETSKHDTAVLAQTVDFLTTS